MKGVNVSIRRLSPSEFALLAPRLVDIYISAMGYDPAVHVQRLRAWRHDMIRAGFTGIIATTPNEVIGVAYGFLGTRETWWDRQVRRGVSLASSEDEADELMRDYFEVAEIHVSPAAQGMGIGRKLLTELLWNIPARTALLSTPEVENEANNAFGLYRAMGFTDVLRHFHFDGDDRRFAVLGRPLPLELPTAG